MVPGVAYSSIPYNWPKTDDAILQEFEAWKSVTRRVVSITGPIRVQIENDEHGGTELGVELVVLYEESSPDAA